MISCLALERPGKWRGVSVAALFLVVALPHTPLLWHTLAATGTETFSVGAHFGRALWGSARLALGVAAVSLAVGLPVGVLAALYEFAGRKALLAAAALPLLVPSLLWAIGWSWLAPHLGPAARDMVGGLSGCVLVFSAGAVPLVLLTSYVAAAGLTGSQVDAARLAGGERALLFHALRHVAAPAVLASALGGVLTLSDPGPGLILGFETAASEILISFSAFHDFSLAGRQCAALSALVLAVAAPLAWFAAPRIASQTMARQSRAMRRLRHRWMGGIAIGALAALVLAATIAPLAGLALPVRGGQDLHRAGREVLRTGSNTLVYAGGAGLIAAALGLLLALFVGRNDRLRTVSLGVSLVLFSLPPAFAALGVVLLGTGAPAWADPLLRTRLTVCLALGLRFFPVAAVLALRAWGSTSASWCLAAGIHGVSLARYLRRVAVPLVLPSMATAALLVGLLATADVGTVLLLHPPGQGSLPLAIFTVMANAPESLVGSLCLAYVAAAGALLTAALTIARKHEP